MAGALKVALSAGERAALDERPTTNLEAYDRFLKGEATTGISGRREPASIRAGIRFYHQAVALDPRFTLAWADLSAAQSWLYSNSVPDPALRTSARREADTAVALGQGDLTGVRALLRAGEPRLSRRARLSYLTAYNDMFWVLERATQDTVLTLSLTEYDEDLGTYGLVEGRDPYCAG